MPIDPVTANQEDVLKALRLLELIVRGELRFALSYTNGDTQMKWELAGPHASLTDLTPAIPDHPAHALAGLLARENLTELGKVIQTAAMTVGMEPERFPQVRVSFAREGIYLKAA